MQSHYTLAPFTAIGGEFDSSPVHFMIQDGSHNLLDTKIHVAEREEVANCDSHMELRWKWSDQNASSC